MSTVYVLNKDGKPLMPTTRGGHVRHLLKEQKARVVRTNPFTIQLLYETDNLVQPLYLGIDPGRTNIGVAVVKTDGTAVFTAHLETRNKEIPKLMQGRKKARRARRTNGRRCRRQRRAKANGTISKKCVKQATAQNGSVSKRANVQMRLVSSNAIFRVARKKSFASASRTKKQSLAIAQDQKAGLHLPQISCCRHTLTW